MKILKKVDKDEFLEFLYDIDLTDKNLYKELNTNNYVGIFQFTGATAAKLVEKIKPQDFEEMVAVNCLARPGTIDFADQYLYNKEHPEHLPYPKQVCELLEKTHNTLLQQEQIMAIFNKIGGFSLEETNGIRGLMKKLSKADKKPEDLKKWDEAIERFTREAILKGISKEEARKIADDLLVMSGYSFNRCFSGDCIIDRAENNSFTIREMYLAKNDLEWAKRNNKRPLRSKYNREGYGKGLSLNNDKRIRPNKIIDIISQGVRSVYKIVSENGKSIKVTTNHKMPVFVDGEIILKNIETGLSVGDILFTRGEYEKTKINYSFSGVPNDERIFKKYEGCGFKEGEKNSAYINGEYKKFKIRRSILKAEARGVCSICSVKTPRLECHHLDGNRMNNEDGNLIVCCPGCHKKMEYQLGRRKKGEKGSLSVLSPIVSIEYVGEEEVYDIEMEAPNHNLCVNGIVACNSHAVAYTYNAIMTLYLSVYFRIYFYSALLTYEVERKGNLLEVLNTIKNNNITILPPDINKSKETFSLFDNQSIIFGLQDIKFVGETPTASIIQNRPYTSLIDFILKAKVNKNVLFALIKVGCFDSIDNNRAKLFYIAQKFHEEKKTIKVEEKLRAIYERVENTASLLNITTTHKDLIEYEKEYFGFNFFNSIFHPILIEKFNKLKSRKLINGCFGETTSTSTKVPVIVNKLRTFNDKNGNPMAFLELEDMNGEVKSIPIFQSYWKHLSEVIKTGEVYLMNFHLNEEGEIMFGSSRWIRDEDKIQGLVKHISQP